MVGKCVTINDKRHLHLLFDFCHINKKVDFRRWLIRYLNERQKLKCVTNHAIKNISYCIFQNRKTMQGFERWGLCCIVTQWLSSSPKNLAWPHPYLIHVMEICIIHHWSNKTEGYKSMSYLSSLPSVSSSTRNK